MIEPDVKDFVDSLQGLASEIGAEDVKTLVKHFAGTRLYVPRELSDDSPLLVLGEEKALVLCRMFGPERIDIPLAPYRKEAMIRWVRQLRAEGKTINAIARSLNMGYRFVQEVLHGAPQKPGRIRVNDPRQIDLF